MKVQEYSTLRQITKFSDGGKKEFGFSHERNDCAVRAISLAYDVSYPVAHSMLKNYGRKDGHGTYGFGRYMDSQPHIASRKAGFDKSVNKFFKSLGSIQKFVKENNKGVFVILISGHTFCVKDGVIHDNFVNKPRAQITGWWRIK